MLPQSKIIVLVSELASLNGTNAFLPSALDFIKTYYNDFESDYIPCKQKENSRFRKGKLEEILIIIFAELCKWNNKETNVRRVSEIMQGLGYYSYVVSVKRYRHMIENIKKDMKLKPKTKNRIRNLRAKLASHKRISCKDKISLKSMSSTDSSTQECPLTNEDSSLNNICIPKAYPYSEVEMNDSDSIIIPSPITSTNDFAQLSMNSLEENNSIKDFGMTSLQYFHLNNDDDDLFVF